MSYRTVSTNRSWRYTRYVGAIVAIVGILLYLLGTALLPFVAACLLAYVLTPIVEFLERRGLSRRAAVVSLCVSFFVLISGLLTLVIPTLGREISTLHIELPRYSDHIHQRLILLQDNVERDLPILTQFNLTERIEQASADAREHLSMNASLLVSNLLFVPLFTWYLLLEGGAMKKALISFVPNPYFETTLNLLYRIDQHLSRYLLGQLINVVCIGLLSAIAYSAIGVEFSVAIGILAGIASVIPYVGPPVGPIAALLVSLLDESSLSKVISIVFVSAAIYVFDHLAVKTFVNSKATDLHPLTIVLILLIGGQLFGFWALLFGIPLFCIAKIFIQEFAGVLQRRRPPVLSPIRLRSASFTILPPF